MVEAATGYTPGEKRAQTDKYPKGRFDLSFPEGGMMLEDPDSSVSAVMKQMIIKAGKNIVKGSFSDAMKMGTPASVHLPKTYLSMLEKDSAYIEYFCREAMTRPDDPQWKLKNVLLSQICSYTQVVTTGQGSKAPLNPILGETITLKAASGTTIYLE